MTCTPIVDAMLLKQLTQSSDWKMINRMVRRMKAIASNSPSIEDLNNNVAFCKLLSSLSSIIKKNIIRQEKKQGPLPIGNIMPLLFAF